MSTRKIITSCTRDCPNTCGLVATVENGRLIRLLGDPDHPLTDGKACHKTVKYIQRVYSPERITQPMVRSDGEWKQVSWDEALDLVAQTMKTVVAESGPESILYYQGYGERTALKLLNKYFFNLLGGVTTMTGSLCGGAGQGAQNLDFGERISHDPLDHLKSRSIILWARNPASTNISLVPIIHRVRKKGGRIVVIDPTESKSVALADRHIRPRPGGDGYLAMGATKLILEAGRADRSCIENWSEGFEAYSEILARYTVEELAALAGVSLSDVTFLAETFMEHAPTATLLGWGLHRYENAHLSIRPIDALGAISGNIGVPGGGVSQGFEEYGPYDPQWWGDHLNPAARTFLVSQVGEEILKATDPEIRMIYVTAGNPLCMAPNSSKIAEGFGKAELVVYSGHFLDDTADMADVFLPATTFLEEEDVVASYGHNYVGPVNKAIAPVGECKSEFHMFCELATRFPFADAYCRPVGEWLQVLCTPIWEQGGSLETLQRGAFRLDAPLVPYENGVFPTPSGRFQFMTDFTPPTETVDPDYPYKLLTIAPHGTICSERTMAEHDPLPVVTLNTAEAVRNGLRDGMDVLVSSKVGQIRARLKVDEDSRRDVVVAERGGWSKAGHGLNALTWDIGSAVGKGTPFYETTVSLVRAPDPAMHILAVGRDERSSSGVFCKELVRLGASISYVGLEDGERVANSHVAYDGLLVFGAPCCVQGDATEQSFRSLRQLMRDFDAAEKPVVGIRLGSQLLARAHGGMARAVKDGAVDFVPMEMTPEGSIDPVIGSVTTVPPLMTPLEDCIDLPEDALLLVRGAEQVNQVFRVGGCSYGFQCHMDVDASVIAEKTSHSENGKNVKSMLAHIKGQLPLFLEGSDLFCRRVAAAWFNCVQERSTARIL